MVRKHINPGFYHEISAYNSNLNQFDRSRRIRIAFPAKFLRTRPTRRDVRLSAKLRDREQSLSAPQTQEPPAWAARPLSTRPELVDQTATFAADMPAEMTDAMTSEALSEPVADAEGTYGPERIIVIQSSEAPSRTRWLMAFVFLLGNGSMGAVWFISRFRSKLRLVLKLLPQPSRSS